MTAMLVRDVQQHTMFPSYCQVCEVSKVFGTLTERRLFEAEHEHGGMD